MDATVNDLTTARDLLDTLKANKKMSVCGGLALMYPGSASDIIGVAIVGAVIVWQLALNKKAAAAA